MAGSVLPSKEECSHLWQQPLIVQQLPRARIPAAKILLKRHQVNWCLCVCVQQMMHKQRMTIRSILVRSKVRDASRETVLET